MSKQNIVAIIPARGGSKGVLGKNIKTLGGHPLIAYSIIACRICGKIDRTVVSTDSEEIAQISKTYGAEVPFMRPKELAGDLSGDIEFVLHAINWFVEHEGRSPELLVHIRPTTPLRESTVMENAISAILNSGEATSLRSVHELPEAPEKMFRINSQGYLTGIFPDDPRPEYYNLPRQAFATAYHPNGYVDIIRTDYVKKNNRLHGPRILGFVTPRVAEVDTIEDFNYLEYQIGRSPGSLYKELMAGSVKGR